MTGGSIHVFFLVVSSTEDRDDGRGDRITTLNTGWTQIRGPKPQKQVVKESRQEGKTQRTRKQQ